MKDTINKMKSIIRRYKTFLELGKHDYMLTNDELEAIRQAIKYLELVYELSQEYRGDKEWKPWIK